MARPHPHKRAVRATAVSILTLLAAMAAIWLAPRVSDAVAAWMRTPGVRTHELTLRNDLLVEPAHGVTAPGGRTASATSSTTAVTLDAGMRFTALGLTCRPPARHGGVVVRLRTSEDGVTWSSWYSSGLDIVNDASSSHPQAFIEALWTGAGRYVQLEARAAGGRAPEPVRLRDVHLVTINSTEDADAGAAVVGVLRRVACAVASLELTPPVSAMTTRPQIVTRAQWGADESWRRGTPSYAPVLMAFVHHTDSGNKYTPAQSPAIVRAIYAYHTKSLHWSDVGYDFLIDRYGTIYEGRYGGVTKGVIGAQVLGFNTGSTGVSIMGTFVSATPPPAAVASLEQLLAWKLDVHHVDPLGTGTLTCGYGQKFKTGARVTFPAIAGHRDANYTDCPGKTLYALLPAIRKAVASIGQPKIFSPKVGNIAISPNGDGVQDTTTVAFTMSEAADWAISIRDAGGALVRQATGNGTSASLTWAGKNDQGELLPEGTYSLTATATSANGEARPATADIRLDLTPPSLTSVAVAPAAFNPDVNPASDHSTLTFVPSESGTARVSILDGGGKVVRRLTAWMPVAAQSQAVPWDGRVLSGGALVAAPEGRYSFSVELRDLAGNGATASRDVVVDRTLGAVTVDPSTISPGGDGVKDSATVRFTLARPADTKIALLRDTTVLVNLSSRSSAAGVQTLTWDGKLDSGAYVASGDYTVRVTAKGSLGTTTALAPLRVDTTRPRLTAPAKLTLARGVRARVHFVVRDRYSPTVRVTATVTGPRLAAPVKIKLGWVKQGVGHVVFWLPPACGAYALTFAAVDQGGNKQSAAVRTAVKVR
ncbi:MAG TPA: FlgD immunoglobulin-like domain containing protein [Thermoleophilia bacterium]|nr:FlgD immunoglobulin-like domain containing protein [Thermoleophilia bacterium]